MDSVLSYISQQPFPKTVDPPLTLPSVASVATRISIMKNPLLPLLLSSALLLPLLLLYFSRLKESTCSASRLPHWRSPHRRMPTTMQVFSLTLFTPSLCLPCSVSIFFFRLLLLSIFEILFLVFSLGELVI